ncbi:hypothetical protein IFM89_037826 [Coptis chinensis]|uniref:Uncharacterized protein n=1 Tax=Coptis chinensis TaxID=261450 RepID=A0A835HMT4_9MAGN|nr:hypothetical protein IFM89_037826 [Coptis chinensis]
MSAFFVTLHGAITCNGFLNDWYWLSVGAQPSEPVQHILFRAGVLPPPPMLAMERKGGPRDTRPINPMTGKYITPNKSSAADELKETADDGKDASEDSSNP